MNSKTAVRILLSLVLFCAIGFSAHAQKGKHRLADEYYQTFNFKKSAEIYEDILDKNPEDILALRRAGTARMRIDQFIQSEEHFLALTLLKDAQPQDLLSLAYVLKVNKKYDEAVVAYESYLLKIPDPYLKKYTEDDWATRIIRDSALFEIRTTDINSPQSDFSPSFSEDGITFSSSRKQGKGKRNVYSWNDQSYLNLYTAKISKDSSLVGAKVIKDKSNSRYHDGTVAYDPIEKVMYFTRNNYLKGKKKAAEDGQLNLGIFYASYEESKLGKLKPFPFNDPNYSLGHPVISEDGKSMYFVSDMPGGFGGTDIWVSTKNKDFWGEPKNLGSKINTPGNEMFPYLDKGEEFIFASDWHAGLGGLDLFYTTLDSSMIDVANFGYPINSSYDDFGLILFDDLKHGYLSSNRPGGRGDDDIYAFRIFLPAKIQISGQIVDAASGVPIKNATILLKDSMNQEVLEVVANTNNDGSFSFDLDYNENYFIVGVKNGYFQEERSIESNDKSGYLDRVNLEMVAYDYGSEGKIIYAETGEPFRNALVILKSADGKVLQEMNTTDGTYFFPLEKEKDYIIEGSAFGYEAQSISLSTKNKKATVITSDLSLFAIKEGTIVRLDNIYYDYNKATIRPDAKRELDRLIALMMKYPTLEIELSSHTDARGTDSYNLRLSQRRAQSAADYIISKGTPKKRVVVKGYGETKLLNKCNNTTECSDKEHQENRRTEFKILKI